MKILIVDDESLIRYSLSVTLKDGRTEVRTAANGGEALQAVRDVSFDLCFLDIHLPDMSGLDIMKLLRSASPKTKIIVMSGEILTEDAKKTVQEHAVLFLAKPFDLDFVRSFTRVVLDRIPDDRQSHDGGLSADRRRHTRTSAAKTVTYSAVSPGGTHKGAGLEASLCDFSDSGVGLCTDCALEPGCRVTIADERGNNEGIVRWSMAADGQDTYRIGVQFSEDLQRHGPA
jgi:CheY-like chemotaxis protein